MRSIHFSKQTLLWECLEMKGSTEIPYDVIRRYDDFKPDPIRVPKTESDQREYWYGKVEDYSSRFLAYESDKLVAIAGFARQFRHEMLEGSGTYLAGLWKENFTGCLLWRVRRDLDDRGPGEKHRFAAFEPRRPMSYRAPSWSWASLDGEITYASQRAKRYGTAPAPWATDTMTAPRISLVGLEPAESEFNFSRAPQNASMTVHGQVVQLMFEYYLTESLEVDDCKRRLYAPSADNQEDVTGFFYPDIMLEAQGLTEVSCLAVCDENYGALDFQKGYGDVEKYSERLMGIALVPIAEENVDVFKRVRLVCWMKRSAFENVGWADVKII